MFKFLIAGLVIFPLTAHAVNLQRSVGKTITVKGRIATIINQHVITGSKEYPFDNYFDIGDEQIIVYSKEKIDCKGAVKVTGRVIEVQAISEKGSKMEGSDYKEYHIVADKWECLKL